jgi:hypothetical protein
MILRNVVRESVARYFASPAWTTGIETMARGREAVMHAHVYADSILHPQSVQRVVEKYFEARGIASERKVKLLSHGKGYTNVYYIQPKGMCHFEVFLRFNTDVALGPMDSSAARGGKTFEYWSPEFMEGYYRKFDFRPMGPSETKEVESYFHSSHWKGIYGVMYYDNERAVHSHCIIDTSLHPEEIKKIGCAAIEARGWEIDRAVSIVFNVNGLDQGKITFLLKKPEIVLELEWQYRKDVVILPGQPSVARVTTTDMVERDMAGVPYVALNNDDIEWIAKSFA